jgi:branched-chain amino acid transport system permease protein
MMYFFAAYQSVLDHILIYALLAMSQYIVLRAGTFSMGTAAFAAIGAYTTAILVTRAGSPAPVAIVSGVALATIASAVMAFPLSRLRGVFQAVATLALVQVVVTVNQNWESLTRGVLGISGIPKVVTTGWLLAVVVVVVIVLHLLGRFSIGRAMDVIREDETVAVSLGIRVAYHQRIAMVLSGVLAGLAGGLHACNSYAIVPEEFGFNMMVNALAMAVLGGRTSVWGALTGAVVLTVLPELFRGFAEYRNVVQGVLMMLVIIYLPNGIADTLISFVRNRRVQRSISMSGSATAGAAANTP